MHLKKKPCDGCNEYITSDFVAYNGDDDSCVGITSKTRITDVIKNLISAIRKRLVRVKSDSLVVTNSGTSCEKGARIELVPSTQPGNKLVLGSDGKPYVSGTSLEIEDLENTELVFKKPITFAGQVTAEDISVTGTVDAAFFKINRNGLQSIVPAFRGVYSPTDTYYFNDFVSYQGKLWYQHSNTASTGSAPVVGPTWTIIVDRGIDGQDGAPPDFTEFRFAKNTNATTPPALNPSSVNPAGWNKTISTANSNEYIWMIIASKKGTDGSLLSNWSTPINTKGSPGPAGPPGINGTNGTNGAPGTPGSDGASGNNGIDGAEPEMRFAKNGSPTVAPAIDVNNPNPTGWTIQPPAISSIEYLWFSKANKRNGALVGTWSTPVRFSGMNGSGSVTIAKFYANIYKRAASQPPVPTGGTFAEPLSAGMIALGWKDGIPSGTGDIWQSTRFFTEDGLSPQWPNWTAPGKIGGDVDSSGNGSELKLSAVLVNPGTPASIPANWVDASLTTNTDDYIWSALRQIENGFPVTNWVVTRLRGEGGTIDPELIPKPYLLSWVFKRTNTTPSTPTGGTYFAPVPVGWSDGIPSTPAGQKVWMTKRLFTEDGLSPQAANWDTPVEIVNTATAQFKFSHLVTAPGTPSTQPNNWHDPGVETGHSETVFDRWMAMRTVINGVTSEWNINPIYGEGGGSSGPTGPMGPAGPFAMFRGQWDPAKQYYGGPSKIEIVKYNGTYYVTRIDAGGNIPVGTYPSNTTYWNSFVGQFETLATGLLLAETAYIKSLGVGFLRTGPGGCGVNGTEHIEIFPNMATLLDFVGQGDPGYNGLLTSDLENLANSIIFFSKDDCEVRNKSTVDTNTLLKIHAIDTSSIIVPAVTTKNDNGDVVIIKPQQVINLTPRAEITMKTSGWQTIINSQLLQIRNTTTEKNVVLLNGVNNVIDGATNFTNLVKAGNIYADYSKILDALNVRHHYATTGTFDPFRTINISGTTYHLPTTNVTMAISPYNVWLPENGKPFEEDYGILGASPSAMLMFIINKSGSGKSVNSVANVIYDTNGSMQTSITLPNNAIRLVLRYTEGNTSGFLVTYKYYFIT